MEEIFRLLPVLDLLLEAPCRLSLALDLVAVVALFQWPLALRLSLQAAWFRLSQAPLALASVALLLSLPVRARVPVTLVEPRRSRRDPPLRMLAVWPH